MEINEIEMLEKANGIKGKESGPNHKKYAYMSQNQQNINICTHTYTYI